RPLRPLVTEGETTRLVAWSRELRAVHDRLREALRVTRAAVADGEAAEPATRDLLLFCHGFCAALAGHHEGEARRLFPAIAAALPAAGPLDDRPPPHGARGRRRTCRVPGRARPAPRGRRGDHGVALPLRGASAPSRPRHPRPARRRR